jgi:hypothetical protein
LIIISSFARVVNPGKVNIWRGADGARCGVHTSFLQDVCPKYAS